MHGRPHFHRLTYPGDGTRFLLVTAPWHAMSASCSLQMSVFGRGIFCPGFRHRAMGTGDISSFLEHAGVTVAALTPWMMEDVARKPNAKEYIEKLEAVLFGGGKLEQLWGTSVGMRMSNWLIFSLFTAVLSPLAGKIWSKYTHIQVSIFSSSFIPSSPMYIYIYIYT